MLIGGSLSNMMQTVSHTLEDARDQEESLRKSQSEVTLEEVFMFATETEYQVTGCHGFAVGLSIVSAVLDAATAAGLSAVPFITGTTSGVHLPLALGSATA
ncbi:hypothetical protein DPEC_G00294450 [Dallia pectoralis]|uniref:Uncharacterized protein n=1 Tax=Dallia pectoralis TaxID=75939 RepID=A0ACC2FIK8_DALPE|nr:hypothetical protein DPEC_G00294450 [Dallia pectoralis]